MHKIVANSRMPESIIKELEKEFNLISPPGTDDFTDAEMLGLVKDADAVLCLRLRKVMNEWIDNAARLKVIGNVAVGFDNIDVTYAAQKKVVVVNTPEMVREATAELAVTLMLSVSRGIVRHHTELSKSLRCFTPFFLDKDMLVYGKTLGIIGCGRIGKTVAHKAQGLGMKTMYYDPFRLKPEDEKALGLVYMPFEKLLVNGDIISIHMPYTTETYHLMNEKTFALMKPSAYFINTARGPIVDEASLIRALKNKVISGAALDVYEFEPSVSMELATLENVIIVPHVGTLTLESRTAMVAEAVSGIRAVLCGETPKNLVCV
jgi:glyoxylate reductase